MDQIPPFGCVAGIKTIFSKFEAERFIHLELEHIRKIIHVDMDAFFASVEQLDNPDLKGKPVAVGGSRERGVVAAASYEARKYGIRSAMPSVVAKRKCMDLIFVKPRFSRYKEISSIIRAIFFEYTDLVEPLSLDEAYLDVTYVKKSKPSATLIAQEIRSRIFKETGLTASAGVSFNKFLAKVASDVNKPDGIYVVTPRNAQYFIDNLEIRKFHGIGKVTAEKLNKMGVWFGNDLKQIERLDLVRIFGKSGNYYYEICRGIDNRPVEPFRTRKSVGAEETFGSDLFYKSDIETELIQIVDILWDRYVRSGARAKTLTFKYKYDNFEQHTRSKTIANWYIHKNELIEGAKEMIHSTEFDRGIRLLGLTLSNFKSDAQNEPVQLTIVF